jgi:hypothetical protein
LIHGYSCHWNTNGGIGRAAVRFDCGLAEGEAEPLRAEFHREFDHPYVLLLPSDAA